MDTSANKLTKEERDNVLFVLNEFSEEHKKNTKVINDLITSIKEYIDKANAFSATENEKSRTDSYPDFTFPEKQFAELSSKLDNNLKLLQYPVGHKVIHHHHISKLVWISAGLFFCTCHCMLWLVYNFKKSGSV